MLEFDPVQNHQGVIRGGESAKVHLIMRNANSTRSQQECTLHPLIHTSALGSILPDVRAAQKGQECGLKYPHFRQTSADFRDRLYMCD